MIRALIRDGRGTSRSMGVGPQGAALTQTLPIPPYGGDPKMRVFRQYLTNGGGAGDSSDMTVDGSSTTVDFWVPAHVENDRYITMLSFAIVDQSATLNEFGNTGAALANGCRLFYSDEMGEVDIHDALTTNFEFVRLCIGQPAFGDAAAAFRANNVVSMSEGYLPALDLRSVFGFQWGVRLLYGTEQRITLRIRDDCTAPDQFDCIAYGFERLPD